MSLYLTPLLGDAAIWAGGLLLALMGLGAVVCALWLSRADSSSVTRQAVAYLSLLWAAGLLILFPSGGAVCWPLDNGGHIHIGWVDATSGAADSPAASQSLLTTHAGGWASHSAATPAQPDPGVVPLLVSLMALAFPLATVWYHLPALHFSAFALNQPPLSPPPRFA